MKWKKIVSVLIISVFVVSTLAAIFPLSSAQTGDYVDNIEIEVRLSRNTGMGDTAEGDIDIFIQTVTGSKYEGISEEWKAKLGTWKSVSVYDNLFLNPAINQTTGLPVTQVAQGEWQFNPFGITKVRYATNWIVDREHIINNMYGGYASARYTCFGQEDPGYDEYIDPIVEDLGITKTGDKDKALTMIDEAMNSAKEELAADGTHGELQKSGGKWQYKPPGGSFNDIELNIVIRVEDERKLIGNYFADQMEDAGFVTNRLEWDRTKAISTAFYSDPIEQQWHTYTGGWIATAAAKYQYWSAPQMYCPFYGYMPGLGGYTSDQPYQNDELDEVGKKLYNGQLTDVDDYWQTTQECTRLGVRESVRVFLVSEFSFYVYDQGQLTTAATDVVAGYSSYFTPRTVRTKDGDLMAAQYSAQGNLYMDNWNRIGGLSDVYGQNQLDMIVDYGVYTHPSTGEYIPVRADFKVQSDFEWDNGNLVKNLDVPSDALVYNTSDEEWKEVGSGVKSATAVTYSWTGFGNYSMGKWHDGHDITERDILAWWAFSKEKAYQDDANDTKYHADWAGTAKPFFDGVAGVEWGTEDGEFTIYGDYSFPIENLIGAHYITTPYKPWQINEAADHCVRETSYAAATGYDWNDVGATWVHFLSSTQCQDFVDTMDNFKADDWIPNYLKSENNCPLPIDASEMASQIDSIKSFYNSYDHLYDSSGPFLLTSSDPQAMRVKMKRFTQADGYPFPEDYWEDKLRSVSFEFGVVDSPSLADVGDPIEVSASARIREQYPTKSVRDADEGNVTVTLLDKNGTEITTVDATLQTAGTFVGTIPASTTETLTEGTYTIEISGELKGSVAPAIVRQNVILRKAGPGPAAGELEVTNFNVDPTEGKKPLEVDISADLENTGDTEIDWKLKIDGDVVDSGKLAANETHSIDTTHKFEEVGDHLIVIGENEKKVTVKGEDQPGFTFALLGISIAAAVVIYRKKNK